MVAVLAGWAARAPRGWAAPALVRRAGPGGGAPAAGAAALALAGVAFAVVEGADRVWLVLRGGGVPLSLPVADGVRVPRPRRACWRTPCG